MAVSNVRAVLPYKVQKVWETVTCLKKYAWRSDLSKIDILDENRFIEYSKEGFATLFTITAAIPYEQWEFDLENNNMNGHWIGIFTPLGTQTEINFTECVTAKKWWMKPFVKAYLKKQQAKFVSDLKKALLQQI